MVSTFRFKKINLLFLSIFTLLFLQNNSKSIPTSCNKDFDYLFFNQLENTDLVCRLGNGFFSDFFRTYASKEKKFSHIGIISLENNIPYVYHVEASELTGIGGVKKEKLIEFLKDINEYTFFRINVNDSIKNRIITKAKYYLNKKTPFDFNFKTDEDSQLYCTELVANCINYGLNQKKILPTLNINNNLIYSLNDIYDTNIISSTEILK